MRSLSSHGSGLNAPKWKYYVSFALLFVLLACIVYKPAKEELTILLRVIALAR